jgi:hypothetical protein
MIESVVMAMPFVTGALPALGWLFKPGRCWGSTCETKVLLISSG